MNGKGGQLPQQELSHGQVIRRLLGLAWRYRGGCIRAVVLQVVLLGIGVISLGLTGVGIDYIRLQVDAGAPSPHWPLGLTPPAAEIMELTSCAAASMGRFRENCRVMDVDPWLLVDVMDSRPWIVANFFSR